MANLSSKRLHPNKNTTCTACYFLGSIKNYDAFCHIPRDGVRGGVAPECGVRAEILLVGPDGVESEMCSTTALALNLLLGEPIRRRNGREITPEFLAIHKIAFHSACAAGLIYSIDGLSTGEGASPHA